MTCDLYHPVMRHPDLQLRHPVGRIACGPGWSRTRRESLRLPDMELWFVWRGRGVMTTAIRQYELKPGFCTVMRPGGIYDARQDEGDPLGIAFVHFDCHRALAERLPEFPQLADPELFDHALRWIVGQVRRAPDGSAEVGEPALLMFRSLLLELARQDDAGEAGGDVRERIIRAFADELRAEGVPRLERIAVLAKRLGVVPARASRLFTRCIGTNYRDFVIGLRIERAQHLLLESGDSVGGIAEQLGFCDIYAFSRQFSVLVGMSPSQYRNRSTAAPRARRT